MNNFTLDIKKELLRTISQESDALRAALSAFLRTSGCILCREENIGFSISTGFEQGAEFFLNGIENLYGVLLTIARISKDQMRLRDRFEFECVNASSKDILFDLGLIERNGDNDFVHGIQSRLIPTEACGRAYLQGAFLGGGSCILPKKAENSTGYHLELVFPGKQLADDVCELLCDYEILAKHVVRGNLEVIYLRSKEAISDFLDVLAVPSALRKLEQEVTLRDSRNNENRKSNCEVNNLDKTYKASAEQCLAIRNIEHTIGLDGLEEPLRQLARARLSLQDASMQQLAEFLQISKSCLSHRMRKLMAIAKIVTTE